MYASPWVLYSISNSTYVSPAYLYTKSFESYELPVASLIADVTSYVVSVVSAIVDGDILIVLAPFVSTISTVIVSPTSFVVTSVTLSVSSSVVIVKLLESRPKFSAIVDTSVTGSVNKGTSICEVFCSITSIVTFGCVVTVDFVLTSKLILLSIVFTAAFAFASLTLLLNIITVVIPPSFVSVFNTTFNSSSVDTTVVFEIQDWVLSSSVVVVPAKPPRLEIIDCANATSIVLEILESNVIVYEVLSCTVVPVFSDK